MITGPHRPHPYADSYAPPPTRVTSSSHIGAINGEWPLRQASGLTYLISWPVLFFHWVSATAVGRKVREAAAAAFAFVVTAYWRSASVLWTDRIGSVFSIFNSPRFGITSELRGLGSGGPRTRRWQFGGCVWKSRKSSITVTFTWFNSLTKSGVKVHQVILFRSANRDTPPPSSTWITNDLGSDVALARILGRYNSMATRWYLQGKVGIYN